MPYKDSEKRREYMRSYRRIPEDKDTVKERNAKYYEEHGDDIRGKSLLRAKERREESPETVKKQRRKSYHDNKHKNKAKTAAWGQAWRKKFKERVIEYLGGHCVACGLVDDWPVFDAHHLDPSTKEFGIGSSRGRSWEEIKVELDKCVLLCSNCHRKERVGLIEIPS